MGLLVLLLNGKAYLSRQVASYLMKKNVSTENVALLIVWNMKFRSVTVRSVLFSVNRDRESQRLGIISESSACRGTPIERRFDYGGSRKPVSSVTSQYVNMDHDEGCS